MTILGMNAAVESIEPGFKRAMCWKGSERCPEVTTAVSGQASGSVERLNAINEHFRSR